METNILQSSLMNQSLEDQIQALAQAHLIQKQALDRHKEQLEGQAQEIEMLHNRITILWNHLDLGETKTYGN